MATVTIVKRQEPLRYGALIALGVSMIAGAFFYAAILALMGRNPVEVIYALARSFVSPGIVKDFLILSMLGYALYVSFKGALFNIGGEGQFYIAAIGVIAVTLSLMPWSPVQSTVRTVLVVVVAILVATLLGGLWGLLAGVFRGYAGIDEVPVTLLLNYVAYYTVDYLVYSVFRGKHTYGYIRTDEIPEAYRLNYYLPPMTSSGEGLLGSLSSMAYQFLREFALYYAWVIGLAVVALVVYFVMYRTRLGLLIRIHGSNPDYLRAIGVDVRRVAVATLALSGSLVGFTASLYVLGYLGRLPYPVEESTANYGYIAILVAWLAVLEYKLIPLAAYIVAALRDAGINLQVAQLGGTEQTFISIGLLLTVFTVVKVFTEYRIEVRHSD